jgi:amino acid transporter
LASRESQGEAHAGRGARKATVLQLVFMTYSVICSGAFGLEEMVSVSGPGLAILTLVVLPVIWAAPISLACAELSARYPVEGGYYRWVRLAFGDFVGYVAGWLVWLTMFATNAAFAVLFASYLRHFVPSLTASQHFWAAVALVWVTTALNYRGIRLVGNASVILTVLIFLPFLVMTVLGFARWRYDPLVPFINPDKGLAGAFGGSLFIAIWLYAGFEKLTVSAEEVENPSRAFPAALAIAVPMAAASYVLPTVAGLAANGDWRDWGESHFSAAAAAIGGPVLGSAMTAAGLASQVCLLLVTMLGQSRLPMVLAADGFFPAVFRRTHPRYRTPVASLLLGGLVLTALCGLRFGQLAGMYALVQALAYMLIYATLFRLRSRAPRAVDGAGATGFRIPVGPAGLFWMTMPSVVLTVLVVVEGLWPEGVFDGRQALIDLVIFASGPATYWVFKRRAGTAAAAPEPGAGG